MSKEINLLFITQRLDYDDPDLAFAINWIDEFIRQGINVQVICLKKGRFDDHFPVFSLGKEKGLSKWQWVLNFYKLIFSLKYNRVFVHMNSEWSALAGWYWKLKKIPFYLWYTHYTMTASLRLTSYLATNMFCATKQSLPQFTGWPKKIVTGHGIDLDFWQQENLPALVERKQNEILMVHRLSKSKRIEIAIQALKLLPLDYSLLIYGRTVAGEEAYLEDLKKLAQSLSLETRVIFKGSVQMSQLKEVYASHRLMINMASETIDKTMLEALYAGVYPITTKGNSEAIGLNLFPQDDQPETIANFVLSDDWKNLSLENLQQIVESKHSLRALITKLISYF